VGGFDYTAPGELYWQKHKGLGIGNGLTYRRFGTGAEAIGFAVEHVPASTFSTCLLEIRGERFGSKELRSTRQAPTKT
jgi:hypothetical protein